MMKNLQLRRMKITVIFLLVIVLVSCGPLDKEYNKATVQQDLKEIREGGIAETDVMLLDYYLDSKIKIKGNIPSHATYKILLEEARIDQMRRILGEFKRNDENTLYQVNEQVRIDSLKKNLKVTLLSKEYISTADGEEFLIKVNYPE